MQSYSAWVEVVNNKAGPWVICANQDRYVPTNDVSVLILNIFTDLNEQFLEDK